MRTERAGFLSRGEKSEGRMGADFTRWGKSACCGTPNPHLTTIETKMLAAITILLILDSLKSNMKKMIGNCCLVNKKTLRIERRNHGFFVY
jgi:hypothetical protein